MESTLPGLPTLLQQSKLRHACLRANEDFAVHNHGSNEFISWTELVTRSSLVAVVQLIRQIGGVVGMQHRRIAVLNRPYNPVGGPIGRHSGRRSRIFERSSGL